MDNFWPQKTPKLKAETRSYYRELIHRLNIYLESHVASSCGPRELGEYLHISHHHLPVIFAEMEQESLGAYIKRYRLEKSASLLQYTRLNLDEIAAATGYSGKHAFSKAFGATFGRSPGAFRKKTPFFKFAANMVMDGIDSEPEYFRLLRYPLPPYKNHLRREGISRCILCGKAGTWSLRSRGGQIKMKEN